MKPTSAELALLRTRPQQAELKLVIYKPGVVFACQVSDSDIQKTAIYIAYDSVSSGDYMAVKPGMTMYVGTSPGKADVGRVRVKNTTSTVLSVAENGLDWADNLYLTVVNFYELWPRSSLDAQNGTNVVHYIDYDVPYGDQNDYMGTFLCIGSPGICEAGQSIYWGSSGTVQTEGIELAYTWSFGGGTPPSGTTSDPGYIQYNTPGYYMTEVLAFPTGTDNYDMTYRPVIVLGGSVQPYTQWGFDSIDGSRDEGGWTAKLWLREENMPEVMDGSLCIIYQDCWYGSTNQNIGGNSPYRSKILFIGYIIDNSITYKWNESKMEFAISSPTGRMKMLEGLSVSMDNVAGTPTIWQQVKNLNGKKALYYYLKWHTTILNCCDVHWMIDPDPEIPSWDSEISSIYDIAQKFIDTYYLGEIVSDRQGGIWVEKHPKSVHTITGSYVTVLDIDRQDWRGEIDIVEQLSSPLSYLEMHGLGYSGIATGTEEDYLSAAPYINKRNPFGQADFIQGYVVSNQAENNQIVGDVFAHRNARFSSVDVPLSGWYSLFDIAPEECVTLTTVRQDTARGMVWNKKHFMIREMSIERDNLNKTLLPTIGLYEVTQGTAGATVPIPTPVTPPTYPEFPPITGSWTDIPWPFDWPKPWVEPPAEGDCRGNDSAPANGPYGLSFSKSQFSDSDTALAQFSCYIRPVTAHNITTLTLYGIIYDAAYSWNQVLVQAVDAGQNVVATATCVEDHGFPGANTYGVYQFSPGFSGIEVAGFKITAPTGGAGGFILGSEIGSGSVDANNSSGMTIGSLTVGKYYAVEASGNIWICRLPPESTPTRYFDLNNGSGWQGGAGHYPNADPALSVSWAAKIECINFCGGPNQMKIWRVYFKATGTSIGFRASDDLFTDNSGVVSYSLHDVTALSLSLNMAVISNICL